MLVRQTQSIRLLISDYKKLGAYRVFFTTSHFLGVLHKLQLNAYILRGDKYEYTITRRNRRS